MDTPHFGSILSWVEYTKLKLASLTHNFYFELYKCKRNACIYLLDYLRCGLTFDGNKWQTSII